MQLRGSYGEWQGAGGSWEGRWSGLVSCHLLQPPVSCTLSSPSLLFPSYGRVYAATDPYHHTIGPTATYSIGTMVRTAASNTRRSVLPGGWVGQEEAEASSQCLALESWEKSIEREGLAWKAGSTLHNDRTPGKGPEPSDHSPVSVLPFLPAVAAEAWQFGNVAHSFLGSV